MLLVYACIALGTGVCCLLLAQDHFERSGRVSAFISSREPGYMTEKDVEYAGICRKVTMQGWVWAVAASSALAVAGFCVGEM